MYGKQALVFPHLARRLGFGQTMPLHLGQLVSQRLRYT